MTHNSDLNRLSLLLDGVADIPSTGRPHVSDTELANCRAALERLRADQNRVAIEATLSAAAALKIFTGEG